MRTTTIINNYSSKNYARATIDVNGDDPYSDFILLSVANDVRSGHTLHGYYNNYKIERETSPFSPYTFSGLLYDTDNTDWENAFIENYAWKWKASKCLRNGKQVTIKYKNITLTGYMINLTIVSKVNGVSEFSFGFILNKEAKYEDGIDSIGVSRPNIDYYEKELGKATISILSPSSQQQEQGFMLSEVSRSFREKYQGGNRYNNIISFGSHPAAYKFIISLVESAPDEDGNTVDESFRRFQQNLILENLTRNEFIEIRYKDRAAYGYVVKISEIAVAGRNYSDYSIDLLSHGVV